MPSLAECKRTPSSLPSLNMCSKWEDTCKNKQYRDYERMGGSEDYCAMSNIFKKFVSLTAPAPYQNALNSKEENRKNFLESAAYQDNCKFEQQITEASKPNSKEATKPQKAIGVDKANAKS
ncbi:hypothetical protein Ddc_04624 [Ditylenchus destructor]|nr:hypothetical protein Ddc_04624 [Ditylenchus destructor]